MSSWFGGGDKSSEAPKDFTSSDDASFGGGGGGGGGYAGAGAGSSMNEMQEFSVQLQQSVLVQTIITNLTDTAFEKCISKPGDSLSGKEVACMHATVGKMMDTNEFMMGRLAKKQQAASSGGGY
jgi:import inner membrane translocase subunit TIM8